MIKVGVLKCVKDAKRVNLRYLHNQLVLIVRTVQLVWSQLLQEIH